jgi:hypothetical protein
LLVCHSVRSSSAHMAIAIDYSDNAMANRFCNHGRDN